ncbi:MAG: tetratricopeptide repeat protein [Planctomycetota bacterium]
MHLALFGGKKKGEQKATDAGGDPRANGEASPAAPDKSKLDKSKPDKAERVKGAEPGVTFNPEKAAAFFEHARTAHETTNYEYAMTLWLQGLRMDPSDQTAMESFFESARKYASANPRKKAKVNLESTKGPADKFLAALLAWGTRMEDGDAAMRAGDAAAGINLQEQAYWCLERSMALHQRAKRPTSSAFKRLMQLFAKIGAYDEAVRAGQIAVQLAPADTDLAHAVKNFSAQATMSQGGYDETGKEGGFRKNIRDAEKQRRLQDEEAISKDEVTIERLIANAREDYQQRPEDPATINQLAKRLLERGTPKDEKDAYELYKRGYQLTREFRFRQAADDIKLRAWRRKLSNLKKKVNAEPDNAELRAEYESGLKDVLEAEIKVYAARVEAYPTDLHLKYELGFRHFELGQHEDAITLLQAAQEEPKLRVKVKHMLAQSFMAMGWSDEAVATFRDALQVHGRDSDAVGMDIRYGLMSALLGRAKERGDAEAAAEADKIASAIAIRDLGFRDIRDKRAEAKELLGELRQA